MLSRVIRLAPPDLPEPPEPWIEPASRPRRAATAMEYLFAISLILVVVITSIGYFGQETKKVVETSSNTIQNATQQPPATP